MVDHPTNGAYRPYPPAQDPTPWAAGLTVTVMVALLATVAVYAFGIALAQVHPLLAVAVNLVAAGGAAPTAWRARFTPVTRWVLLGCGVGVVLGWLALVVEGLSAL
ncbi:DUF2537 domain-containing protein [Nocardia xishanensis]|uniref:DUF2537 domain-containing protein n=1 Tax=Nocardia xishanensis TaxID=238964 RepID=A0ABW7WXJ2_9NOCA|nr:DUF2537 domain-containing protein [Nocardia xishanensis]